MYNNITLSATGIGWIAKEGQTRIVLRSAEDVSNNYVGINYISYSRLTTKLYVTYTMPSTNFNGPYYRSGTVATNTSLRVNYNTVNGTSATTTWTSNNTAFNQTLGTALS